MEIASGRDGCAHSSDFVGSILEMDTAIIVVVVILVAE